MSISARSSARTTSTAFATTARRMRIGAGQRNGAERGRSDPLSRSEESMAANNAPKHASNHEPNREPNRTPAPDQGSTGHDQDSDPPRTAVPPGSKPPGQ